MDEHFAAVLARRAGDKHIVPLRDIARPRSDFDRALLALLRQKARTGTTGLRDGRRKAMLAVFNQQATWPQIRRWRRGKAPAPKWALDILAKELETIGEEAKLFRSG